MVDLWIDFIKRFKRKIQKFDGSWVFEHNDEMSGDYYHQITLFPTIDSVTLTIDYNDIRDAVIHQGDSIAGMSDEYHYTVYDYLAKQVENNANEARHCARLAVIRLIDDDYRKIYEDLIRVEFSGILLNKEISSINSELVNKFVKIEGVVIYRDDRSINEHYNRVYQCSLGHLTKTTVNRLAPPTKCAGFDPISKEYVKCEEQFLEENDDLAKKEDRFDIMIQERTDRVTDFRNPGAIWVRVLGRDSVRNAIKNIHNADYLTICGIVREEESSEKSGDKKVKLYEYYIQSSSIQKRPVSDLVQDDPQLKELVKVAVQSDSEEEDYMKLVRSVAPDIYKSDGDVVAEAVLLTCVGSDERTNPISGSRTRGEIQLFLCGDSATAKTSYLKFACKAVARSFYNSGDKTSSVSLIGGVKPTHKEGKSGKLEVGIFALAQLVGLDELEKMKLEELKRLSEPMQDDQSITLAKQGYYKERPISVAVIALANPVEENSRWDVTKDLYYNTKLPAWLISRFDAIFIVRDVQDDYSDLAKINFKSKSMRNNMKSFEFEKVRDKRQFVLQSSKSTDNVYSIGFMRHWIQYVRDTFHPDVWKSEECLAMIDKFYMQFRKYSIRTPRNQEEKDNWTRDKEIPAIEMRGYMALCRFTEAHARACHRDYCTIADAEAAINIVRVSKLSAGLNMNSLLSGDKIDQDPELRELKLKAMQQIKIDMLDRQKTAEGRTFSDQLEKISWIRCTHPKCQGQGVVYDGDMPFSCPECLGNGGFRKAFTQNDLYERCNNARVPIGLKMFGEMFKRALMSGEIVLDKSGPVKTFQNTKSRLEYMMDKNKIKDTEGSFEFLKDETQKETAEGIIRRRLMEQHGGLAKRLAELDDDKKEDGVRVGAALVEPNPPSYVSDNWHIHKEVVNVQNIEIDKMKKEFETMKKYLAELKENPPKEIPLTDIPRDPVYRDWKKSQMKIFNIPELDGNDGV